MSSYGNGHYLAPWPKLLAVVIIVLVLVAAAFLIPARRPAATAAAAPSAWVVLASVLAAGLLFFLTDWSPTWLGVAQMIVALAGAALALGVWSRRAGWGHWHRLAAAAGGLLTYGWYEFGTTPLVGGGAVITPISHVVCALIALTLLFCEVRGLRRRGAGPAVAADSPARVEP
jgi:hypothetical protein